MNGNQQRSKRKVMLETPSMIENNDTLPSIDQVYTVGIPVIIKKPLSETVAPKCNYFPLAVSVDSIKSNLPDHWREEHHRSPRGRPSESEIQQVAQKPFDEDKSENNLDESEVLLPRIFFPLGIDWDTWLEDKGYGDDVVVKSESSSSSENKSEEVFDDLASVTEWFIKKHTLRPTIDASLRTSDASSLGKHHHRASKSSTSESAEKQEFLKGLRQRDKDLTDQRSSWDNYCYKLNTKTREEGPQGPGDLWLPEGKAAVNVMSQITTGNLKGNRQTVLELMKKPCLKNTVTFGRYIQHLKRLKNKISCLDVRQVRVTNALLDRFCSPCNNSVIFDLQGRRFQVFFSRRLEDFDLPFLFLYMIRRPNIDFLDLSYNHLTGIGLRFLADYLSWDTCIVDVNLMNNDVEGLDSYIVDALAENSSLKSLRLNGNPIGAKGGEFASFLVMFKDLEHLDLGQTDQTVQSICWMSQASIQISSLKILNLSRVLGYSGYDNDSLHYAIAFSDILRFSSLLELHIQKNNLSDVDLEQILFGLSFNKTLKLLDLNFNSIGNAGAEMLADSLHRGGPLKAVMLAGNRIGEFGARAIGYKLPASEVRFLDLSNNAIGDEGIIDIIQTVHPEPPMMLLYIFGNPFGSRAAKVIDRLIRADMLNPQILDIQVYSINNTIGYSLKPNTNWYQAKYYQTPGYKSACNSPAKEQNDYYTTLQRLSRPNKITLPPIFGRPTCQSSCTT